MPVATSIVAHRRSRPVLLLIPLVVGLCIWAYSAIRHDFSPKRFGVVVPGSLYRSGQLSPRMIKPTLERYSIKVIVDFQGPKDQSSAIEAELVACKELGVEHHFYPLSGDGTGPIERYADALTTIVETQRASKPVLIHCSAGTQRTGAAVAFYRMLVERKPASEAYEELSRYDWDPKKDTILIVYINDHIAELAQMLQSRGVIEQVPTPLPRIGP